MFTKEMIIAELKDRGYNADIHTTIKNGVSFDGVRIFTDDVVAPVIYTDEIIGAVLPADSSLEEVVAKVIDIYENNKTLEFDLSNLSNKDYFLSHIYIGLQKEGTEKIIKRACMLDGIECYLYLRCKDNNGDTFVIKVNRDILKKADITEDKAWNAAECNIVFESTIQSMTEILIEMFGEECQEDFKEEFEMLAQKNLYVISNDSRIHGASAILDKELLKRFGKNHNISQIVVLPSSINEMIIIPYTDDMDMKVFSDMVYEVNHTEVAPEERLTDRAYLITV